MPSKGRYSVIAGHFSPATTNTLMQTASAGPLVAKLVTANHVQECAPPDEEEYSTAYQDNEDLDPDNITASDKAAAAEAAAEAADPEDEIHHLWRVEILVDGELLQLEYSSCFQSWRLEDEPSNQERWSSLETRYGESSLRWAICEALDSPLWPGCNF